MGRVDSNAPEAPGWQKLRTKAYLRVADLTQKLSFPSTKLVRVALPVRIYFATTPVPRSGIQEPNHMVE